MILSIEQHCSPEQQRVQAHIFQMVFGGTYIYECACILLCIDTHRLVYIQMHIAAWCTYTLVKCIEEYQVYLRMYVSVYIHGCITDLHCFWWLLCHFLLTDKLLTAPINPSSHELPSPNALKYKIILKHKKLGESLQTVKAFDGFGSQDSKLCVSCGDGCTSPPG